MKTIFTLFTLAIIIGICAISAALYLNQHYPSSALLSLTWIVAITHWIKANGFLDDKQGSVNAR
jgi:hypothetical protein